MKQTETTTKNNPRTVGTYSKQKHKISGQPKK